MKKTALLWAIALVMLGCTRSVPPGADAPSEPARTGGPAAAKTMKYAALEKGVPVHIQPGRTASTIATIPWGEEVQILELKDVAYKEIRETWARLDYRGTQGWALRYYLHDDMSNRQTGDRDFIIGTWRTPEGDSFTFLDGGGCQIEPVRGTQIDYMIQGLSGHYYGAVHGYTWEIDGDTVTVYAKATDMGDDGAEPGPDSGPYEVTEPVFTWTIEDRHRRRIGSDSNIGLYADSPLREAVVSGDMDELYTLLENAAWTPEDFEDHPAEEGNESLFTDLQEDKGKVVTMGKLSLIAIALSQDPPNIQAARILVDHGADVNGLVQELVVGYGAQIKEPLVAYFYRRERFDVLDFLLNNKARLEQSFYEVTKTPYRELRYAIPVEGLNMRDAPSLEGKIIARVPSGSCVAVIEESGVEATFSGKTGRWTRVLWGYTSGWVFGGMLGAAAP